MEVSIGKEKHKFVEGPFTTFGTQVLEQVGPGVPSCVLVIVFFPIYSLQYILHRRRKNTEGKAKVVTAG